MKKRMLRLAVFAIPHSLVIFFCLIMIFSSLATPFIGGFALDSQGNLYVGEGKIIRVFREGEVVRSLTMKADTYVFTIDDTDKLVVAYPSTVYRMDLFGNVLEIQADSSAQKYQEIEKGSKEWISPTGDQYRQVSQFGWTRILKNDTEEVYRISFLSFAVKILLYTVSVSLIFNTLWLVTELRKTD